MCELFLISVAAGEYWSWWVVIVDTFVDHSDPHWPDVSKLMIPTGCWAKLPGNHFAFVCKQRADPSGLFWGRKGLVYVDICILVCVSHFK